MIENVLLQSPRAVESIGHVLQGLVHLRAADERADESTDRAGEHLFVRIDRIDHVVPGEKNETDGSITVAQSKGHAVAVQREASRELTARHLEEGVGAAQTHGEFGRERAALR